MGSAGRCLAGPFPFPAGVALVRAHPIAAPTRASTLTVVRLGPESHGRGQEADQRRPEQKAAVAEGGRDRHAMRAGQQRPPGSSRPGTRSPPRGRPARTRPPRPESTAPGPRTSIPAQVASPPETSTARCPNRVSSQVPASRPPASASANAAYPIAARPAPAPSPCSRSAPQSLIDPSPYAAQAARIPSSSTTRHRCARSRATAAVAAAAALDPAVRGPISSSAAPGSPSTGSAAVVRRRGARRAVGGRARRPAVRW